MSIIQRVCQYCGVSMGTKEGNGVTGVSHGICPTCVKLPDDERMKIFRDRVSVRV